MPAAFTTINGDGGNDTVIAQSGYDAFNQGVFGDGVSGYTDGLTLTGQQNTVTGGDGHFDITDTVGGQNNINLGGGGNTIIVAGSYNNITLHSGQSNITFLSGSNNTVGYDSPSVGSGSTAAVVLYGSNNTITSYHSGSPGHSGIAFGFDSFKISGGDGGSVITADSLAATVTTDGLYNTVSLGSGTGDITPGSGHDTVNLHGYPETSDFGSRLIGNYTVHLKGVDNVVSAHVAQLTIDGGDGSSQFIFELPDDNYDNYRPFVPELIYKVTTGGIDNTFALSDVESNTITTGSGDANVSIYSIIVGPPNPFDVDAPGPIYPGSTIIFDGLDNLLNDLGHAPNTIMGGTGEGTFLLGSGNDTLTTGGSNNKVTAGAGTDTISPGSDHAIVTLNGTNAHLMLQGDGNAVFLNAGASGVIDGASTNLHVTIAPNIGVEVLNGLASDPHTVIALTGGAGGYTSTSQIETSLTSDGHGGTLLAIGSGSLDFAGVKPHDIFASMFVVKA